MKDLGDYLERKAQQLGLDRADRLKSIQKQLDEWYPGQCRAVSINDGVLKVVVFNAGAASELRMRQSEILGLDVTAQRLVIRVG